MKFEGFSFKKESEREKKQQNKQNKKPRESLYSCSFKYEVGTNEVLVLEGVEK